MKRVAPRVAFGLLVLLILYMVYLGGAWVGIYAAEIRQTTLVFVAVVLLVWFVTALRSHRWRPATRLWAPLMAALVVQIAATVVSRSPRISVEYLAWSVILTVLYLLLVRLLADQWFRDRIMAIAAVLCAVTGLWYLLAVVAIWGEWWQLVGRVSPPPLRPLFEGLTFGNPSAVMTISVLLLAPAAAFVGVGSPRARASVAALVGLTTFAIIVSGSRAGWLAVVVALAIVAALWVASGRRREAVRAVLQRHRRSLAVAAVAAVALGVLVAPGIASRIGAGGEALRATYYATALRMWGESPLIGNGPGSWVAQRIEHTVEGEPDYYIPHAHNLYLQSLAEFGVAGVLVGLVAVVTVTRLVQRSLRSTRDVERRMAWAAVFSITYFTAHQVLDFYANMPAALFAFALPIAYLDAAATEDRTGANIGQRLPAAQWATAALTTAALAALAPIEAVATEMSTGVNLANRGEWAMAVGPVERAARVDPDVPAYQLSLGLVRSHAGDHLGAADAFRRAAAADDLPESWLNLAAEEAALGRREAALAAVRRSLRLGVQRAGVAAAAGDLALRLGDVDTARRAVTRAIEMSPTLAADEAWKDSPSHASLVRDATDAAIRSAAPEARYLVAMQAGRVEEARAMAPREGPAGELATLVLDAWTGDAPAMDALIALAEAQPIAGPIALVALVAGHQGHAEATRLKQWADVINAGTDPRAYEVVVRPPADRAGAYSLASFYGHYTYRRPTPWDLLGPSLIHLELE